eukprot:UN27611
MTRYSISNSNSQRKTPPSIEGLINLQYILLSKPCSSSLFLCIHGYINVNIQ